METLELTNLCSTTPVRVWIDDEGDLCISDDSFTSKPLWVDKKDIPKLTKWLLGDKIDKLDKFSVERRAWQKAVQECELF